MKVAQRNSTEYKFASLTAGREREFPTLARALQDEKIALYPMIEWTVEGVTWRNYTQNFRVSSPFRSDDELKTELLSSIEKALVHGLVHIGPSARLLGGYVHYLGRELRDGDHLALWVLRQPVRRIIEQDQFGVYLDAPISEYIAAVSLSVTPGP